MTPITLDQVQQDLLHQLPDAMRLALESYTAFVTQPVDHDPKNYAAHHAGGKAALSHLEALLKLSKWVIAEQQSTRPDHAANTLQSLIQQAQQALQQEG